VEDVRACYPLTSRYLGEHFVAEAELSDARSFLDFVNERHGGGLIADRAARDLARYESALARLAAAEPLRAREEPLPASDVPLVLSPRVSLLMFGADLPGMASALRRREQARPRPRRGWLLLLPRGEGKVEERELTREDEGWLLEWFRDPTPLSALLTMVDDPAPFEEIWRRGLLDPAAR
jgi:hypothetical protein